MPLIDAGEQDILPTGGGLRFNEPAKAETPSLLDVGAALSRDVTLPGAAYSRFSNPDYGDPTEDPAFEPLDHIHGYEQFADSLALARSPAHLNGMKARIDQHRADTDVLDRAGVGFKTKMVAGLLDPSFLASIAVPELALAKSARLGGLITEAVRGGVQASAYEVGMQALDESRSGADSAFNVGGGMLLGGILGASLARRTPRGELERLRETLATPISEVGAASAEAKTTLEQQSFAPGGDAMTKIIAKVPYVRTDMDIVMASDSVAAKRALEAMADIPGVLTKNVEGIATEPSVYNLTQRHVAAVADYVRTEDSSWAQYKQRVPKEQQLTRNQFSEEIAHAARNEDVSAIPEVEQATKVLRKGFDDLWADAKQLKLVDDPAETAKTNIEKKAVDQYVKAESRQIYADYSARANQAINEPNLEPRSVDNKTFTGETLSIADRSAAVRQQLELATNIEKRASEITSGNIDSRQSAAEANYDKRITDLRREQELNQAALAAQNEAGRKASSESSALNKDHVKQQLALSLSIERQVKDISRGNADSALEAARRSYAAERSRISSEVEPGKRIEARLRAKIVYEQASKEHGIAIGAANAQAEKNRAILRDMHGRDAIKAASKFARETPSLREAFQYGRNIERARSDLLQEINKISKAKSAERARLKEAVANLNKAAMAELDKLAPASRGKFIKRAEKVNRTGEADASEEVNRLAKLLKDQELGKLKGRVTIRELRPNEGRAFLAGDKSYFRRMWDRDKIQANRSGWDAMLRQHFGEAGDPEIAAAVNDVTSQLLHNDVGLSNWSTKVTVPAAGPLKGRTLDIPTKLAEPYLVNDPIRVLESYTRDLAPQVEMARRFGDVEMKGELQKVVDEFAIKKEQVQQSAVSTTEKTKLLNELDAQEKGQAEALVRVRDRILGRAGRLSPDASDRARALVMKVRGWRNWVAATRMGGVAVTGGLMDTARIAATYGFLPTITKLTQLVVSPAFRELSYAQARRAGAACEAALARRAYDAFGGSMTDGWTQKMLHGVYKYTGLSHTTDFTRVLAGSLFEDRLIRAANKVAEGGSLKKFDAASLANLGFDDARLKAVAAEVTRNGGDAGGVFVSGSHNWADRSLASLYDSALLKESHIVVMQPGAADRVWWMDSETGKLIGQLKTFSLSTPMRMTVTPVQMFANGSALQGAQFLGYMMIGGYLTHVFRQAAAGQAPVTDPLKAAQEAFSEAGLAGILPDIVSPASHLAGSALKESHPDAAAYFGGPVKYSDRNPISAFGGPSLGAAQDAWDFLYNRAPQGQFTAKDLHAGRRLIPGQNVWWLRRGINALEGETADALNLEGATNESASERLFGFAQ